MKAIFSRWPRASRQRCLIPASLVALVVWLTWLGLHSWTYHQGITGRQTLAAIPPASAVHLLHTPLDNRNIAKVFGALPVELDHSQSSQPLTLLASLLGNQPERSRALIQYADSRAFYTQGEQLPDGAMLKSVSADQVVILRNGREQRLLLAGRQMRLLSPQTRPPQVVDRKFTTLLHAIENTP